jgi:hypothetical protein
MQPNLVCVVCSGAATCEAVVSYADNGERLYPTRPSPPISSAMGLWSRLRSRWVGTSGSPVEGLAKYFLH